MGENGNSTLEFLGEADPNHPALDLAEKICVGHDRALVHSLKQMDEFIAAVNEMKLELTDRTELMKRATRQHFALVAEFAAGREKMRARLEHLRNGGNTPEEQCEETTSSTDGPPDMAPA